jgi:hypothetical protein
MIESWCNDTCLTVFLPTAPVRMRPEGSNKTRILGDLLDDVLAGFLSVQEADVIYGRQTAHSLGRKRRFASFADWLRDRIAYAESPAVERQLSKLLMTAGRRMGRKGLAATAADTRLVNRLLDETGRERAARLRELLAELDEGVPLAA